MAKPLGLYEGLLSLPKTGLVAKDTTQTPSNTEASPLKKRPNETSALTPTAKRVALAPRVALLNQQHHQQEEAKKTNQVKVVVKDEGLLNAAVRSSNVTLALNETKDPYDPSKPNLYDDYLEFKKRQQFEEEQRRAEIPGIPLPPVKPTNKNTPTPNLNSNKNKPAQSNIAESMMLKMGWKGAGHGIGRNEQGMALPLIAQKSATGQHGVIINTSAVELQKNSINPTGSQASRVIVLTNMVGPGEVDDLLEEETTKECEKYGVVLRCEVWEARRPNTPSDEAVKIYVKFKYQDQALKALMDIDGRFFGGRTVRADYYPELSFDANEYQNE